MNEAVPLKTLKTPPLNLPKNRDAFYGGKWHKPISGRSADTINPGTGAVTLGPTLSGVSATDVSVFGMAAIPPISTVPEPRSYAVLLAAALIGVLLLKRRKVAA